MTAFAGAAAFVAVPAALNAVPARATSGLVSTRGVAKPAPVATPQVVAKPSQTTPPTTAAKPRPAAHTVAKKATVRPRRATPPTTRPAIATTAIRRVVPPPVPTTVAQPAVVSITAPAVSTPGGYGCAAALSYLAAHAAPGFIFECPGFAEGHQAMTCMNIPGVCPNEKLIAIADPCAAAYMNEAHNSWIEAGLAQGSYDPFGYCH